MAGKASSSQASVGGLGSGAVSHVFIQYPPLRCNIPSPRGLYYDDGNKLLLSPTSDQVCSWKTAPFSPNAAPNIDSITEGPICSIRFSLDEKHIAVQRSNTFIQFFHRETGETFIHRCKSDSESILGFFWTDCPSCDIVVVKTRPCGQVMKLWDFCIIHGTVDFLLPLMHGILISLLHDQGHNGLDLFAYDHASKSLALVETKKMTVSWYVYTHESRLVLLASGMQCKTFHGFQVSSAGIIRLPKFEMVMAKPEANSKPVLASEDVYIVTVYGRIYCLQVDRVAMVLHSYRFYRDAIIQQGSLPIYSHKVAVSVVDNVLLVHQVDAKVVILYDIFSDSRAPISAPLPVLLRGFPSSDSFTSRPDTKESGSLEASDSIDNEAIVYGDGWTFLVPDLICDIANKCAISASSSEVPSVLEFLQRRKLEANKAKELCLAITQTLILERRPITMVAKAMDALVTSYALSLKIGSYFRGIKTERTPSSVPNVSGPGQGIDVNTSRTDGKSIQKSIQHESASRVNSVSVGRPSTYSSSETEDSSRFEPSKISSNDTQFDGGKGDMDAEISTTYNPLNASVSEQQESQFTSPAISPDEMYRFVFAPIEEEMIGEPSYLVSIILEFFRSANLEKVKVHPNLYVLTIQILARSEQYAELGLFVINKIIEPSKEVALQLLESGRQNFRTRKLGADMLRQISLHQDYVLLLVQDGYYIEALRYARKHKVTTIRPSLFLEAATSSNDSQHLAAVLRFFSDSIPGFRSTSDFFTYYHILNEMNSSSVVA
ncbi:putative Ribosomal protein S9 [Hibiscus syriacus]|uniref:Ribosomal protein S9 n=1 Tax=Hibiscus syriacus TaxID=106335 RepID=A0A6A2YKU7_HIBSY|nr:putative Ribosomal protein S9 [Hibiscus syriacus]